jgi:putative transposon-encoded protein
MHIFKFRGYALKEKTVGRGNASSSRVNLPKAWEGKKVAVVLLQEIKEE